MKELFLSKTDIRKAIALMTLIGALLLLAVLLFHQSPSSNKELIYTSAGYLFGNLGAVYSFYFGSSKTEVDAKKVSDETAQKNEL
jgi:hypothetical protein